MRFAASPPGLPRRTDAMLVLFETPAGFAVFKIKDEGKIASPDSIYKEFETPERASSL